MAGDTPERAFLRYLERGEAEAFAAFYDLTVDAVLAVAVRLASDLARAEDLVQATYLAALEGRARWDRELPLVPWLVGICTNQARKACRTTGRDAVLAERERPARQPRPAPNPHALAERQELRDALAASIAKLPELYRPVLVLTLDHELTPAAIGRALGRPAPTVRSQLCRGLDLLRAALPRGIAPLALAGLLSTRGLAAVKQVVVAEAAVVGSAIALLPAVGGVVLMKTLIGGVVVALMACAAWLVLPRGEALVDRAAHVTSTASLHAVAPLVVTRTPVGSPPSVGNAPEPGSASASSVLGADAAGRTREAAGVTPGRELGTTGVNLLKQSLTRAIEAVEREMVAGQGAIDTDLGKAANLARLLLERKRLELAIEALGRGDYVVAADASRLVDRLPAHATWVRCQGIASDGGVVPVTIVVDKRAYPDYGRIESMLVQVDDVDLQMKMQAFNQRPLAERKQAWAAIANAKREMERWRASNPSRADEQIASQYALAHAVLPGPRISIDSETYQMVRF